MTIQCPCCGEDIEVTIESLFDKFHCQNCGLIGSVDITWTEPEEVAE